jgi:hypothetical protein
MIRGENLLWNSLDAAGAPARMGELLTAIQRAAGRDMTVFGIKHHQGRLFWELYFYDPEKCDAGVTATAIATAVEPHLRFDALPRETVPYFMWSFDLSNATAGRADGLNLYMAEPHAQAGRSYKLTRERLELENTYHFLHPKLAVREVMFRIKSSVFVDFSRIALSKVLLPELFTCRRICVAKKRQADAVYYSGIDVDQLLWFLRRFDYPSQVTSFVDKHRGRLEHLRFDVGIDYAMDEAGRLLLGKTSYYSTL